MLESLFETYELADKHWSENEKRNIKKLAPNLAHLVDARLFIEQLQILHLTTNDRRFLDAVDALNERGLVSSLKWVAITPFNIVNDLEDDFNSCAIGVVQILVEERLSLRLALANAVAMLGWPGNSFEAATKSLERLWRSSCADKA